MHRPTYENVCEYIFYPKQILSCILIHGTTQTSKFDINY